MLQNPNFPLPSATHLRRRLKSQENDFDISVQSNLPKDSRIALSLDCWSSTTRLQFMAIIAYYITTNWELKEMLIGFESLTDCHSGALLARTVNKVLEKYQLTDRIVSITTDNASNNGTMMDQLNGYLDEALSNGQLLDNTIQHIPCLAHIIQLALKALLGKLRLRPTNDEFILNWEGEQQLEELNDLRRSTNKGIPWVLAKVSYIKDIILIFILIFDRFGNLQFLLILVVNANIDLTLFRRI